MSYSNSVPDEFITWIRYNVEPESWFNLTSGKHIELQPTLHCSKYAANPIVFYPSSYMGAPVPPWLAVDPSSGKLIIDSPLGKSANHLQLRK